MLFKLFIYLLIILSGTYILTLGFLYLKQDKLIFHTLKPNHSLYQTLEPFSQTLQIDNKVNLQGWKSTKVLLDTQDAHQNNSVSKRENNSTIIYFGGNAQDVGGMLTTLHELDAKTVYTFNYRGYGLSEGKPSEESFYTDALHIFDYVKKDSTDSKIIIVGHSLGSTVAGYLAKHRKANGLILVCPLDSIARIAKENFYAPNFLIKHKFKLSESAKNILSRTLVIIAKNDMTIPNQHSEITFENLKGEKKKYICQECDHNDVFSNPKTIQQINGFLHGVI